LLLYSLICRGGGKKKKKVPALAQLFQPPTNCNPLLTLLWYLRKQLLMRSSNIENLIDEHRKQTLTVASVLTTNISSITVKLKAST